MPYIETKTNVTVSPKRLQSIQQKFGSAISILSGKSESWLMVSVQGDIPMSFQGNSKACAMCTVNLFGSPDEEECGHLTRELTRILSAQLNVPKDRIYISYRSTDLWGWNGQNF